MLVLTVFYLLVLVFSFLTTLLSLVFIFSPDLFSKIEEYLGMEFGGDPTFNSAIEGKVNLLHDWVSDHRAFFGPLFVVTSAINTKNVFLVLIMRQ